MIKTKKQMFLVVGAFALILMLGGVTYAFFNYTRTGAENVVRTGRISFTTNQTDTIALTNAFPITRTMAATDTTNTDDVVITITGDTTYSGGIEYLVTATDVTNTVNSKTVPISVISTVSGTLGTADEDYFDNRGTGAETSIYKVLAKETISEGDQLLVGYIKSGNTGVNGSITIRAYFDKDLISISDTYDAINGVSDNMGTTSEWVNGRTNFTTTEWNSLTGNNALSFKVKVEANEGTWVEEKINMMNTFPSDVFTSSVINSIKEVYFIRENEEDIDTKYESATIKADLTYNNKGSVKSWVESDKLYVASTEEIYLNTGYGLFAMWSNVEKIDFSNVNFKYVETMSAMFYNCSNLSNINFYNTSAPHLLNIGGMFSGCSKLEIINLSNFNSKRITVMSNFVYNCTKLKTINISNIGLGNNAQMNAMFTNTSVENIDMTNFDFGYNTVISPFFHDISGSLKSVILKNANTEHVTNMAGLFEYSYNLINVDFSNIDTSNVTNMSAMFRGCSSLTNLDLSNFDTSSVTNMAAMFSNCALLQKIYVSNLWNVSNLPTDMPIFSDNTNLVGESPNGTTYAFTDYNVTDKTYAVIATDTTPGYLTDISLKPTN